MDRLDALLEQYEQKFGDCFPLMFCRGKADDEICEIVQDCLDKDAPFDPEVEAGADY